MLCQSDEWRYKSMASPALWNNIICGKDHFSSNDIFTSILITMSGPIFFILKMN